MVFSFINSLDSDRICRELVGMKTPEEMFKIVFNIWFLEMPRGFKIFEEFESGKYICLEDNIRLLSLWQITYTET